ncbi:DUF4181 domain-containing protein [Salimicrobium flavidum]|uniref:DUF4181 domain-containing protein n=1 Tax=Salimicrobium flavidum TaxID=570947 RepID=A0A1N7KPY6_9BACI|nr:DUF4181 domain-containing protein [Salimicrobium flavidum]SIS63480.1 protein of unknown function [Salimicrobium flavidum]
MKLALVLTIFVLLGHLVTITMRKILQVEKRGVFSRQYLSEMHKKMEWMIRITFLVMLVAGVILVGTGAVRKIFWFMQPHVLLIITMFMTELLRAVMEWKHEKNRNAYIFTLSQLALIIIFMIVLFLTDLLVWYG